jgi:hypothetical protein
MPSVALRLDAADNLGLSTTNGGKLKLLVRLALLVLVVLALNTGASAVSDVLKPILAEVLKPILA